MRPERWKPGKMLALPLSDRRQFPLPRWNYLPGARGGMPPEHTGFQPKLVYISHSTENGALYTLQDLEVFYRGCREYGLYLFC